MEKIQVKDFGLYLFGHEESIRKLARSDKAIYVGAFFVLIAGVCREYDQEYILAKPMIFLFPFIASFVLCVLLRFVSQFYFRLKNNIQPLGSFKIFLSLFWLTAPCAWIYALPVEMFFDSLTALQINLWMLAFVATWRVWLLTRVMKVLTGINILPAILALGSPVILIASWSTVLNNMVTVMSGGNYSEEQKLLIDVNGSVASISMLATLPLLALYFYHSTRQRTFTPFEEQQKMGLSTFLKLSCFLLVIASVVMMIKPQAQLARLFKFKKMVTATKYSEAVEYANQFERHEFPVVRKIYPPLKYYGFDDAMALLAQLKGTEKEWFRKGVEKWVSRGLDSTLVDFGSALEMCPPTDYHINYFRKYKGSIEEYFNYYKELPPKQRHWLYVLKIKWKPNSTATE